MQCTICHQCNAQARNSYVYITFSIKEMTQIDDRNYYCFPLKIWSEFVYIWTINYRVKLAEVNLLWSHWCQLSVWGGGTTGLVRYWFFSFSSDAHEHSSKINDHSKTISKKIVNIVSPICSLLIHLNSSQSLISYFKFSNLAIFIKQFLNHKS